MTTTVRKMEIFRNYSHLWDYLGCYIISGRRRLLWKQLVSHIILIFVGMMRFTELFPFSWTRIEPFSTHEHQSFSGQSLDLFCSHVFHSRTFSTGKAALLRPEIRGRVSRGTSAHSTRNAPVEMLMESNHTVKLTFNDVHVNGQNVQNNHIK